MRLEEPHSTALRRESAPCPCVSGERASEHAAKGPSLSAGRRAGPAASLGSGPLSRETPVNSSSMWWSWPRPRFVVSEASSPRGPRGSQVGCEGFILTFSPPAYEATGHLAVPAAGAAGRRTSMPAWALACGAPSPWAVPSASTVRDLLSERHSLGITGRGTVGRPSRSLSLGPHPLRRQALSG